MAGPRDISKRRQAYFYELQSRRRASGGEETDESHERRQKQTTYLHISLRSESVKSEFFTWHLHACSWRAIVIVIFQAARDLRSQKISCVFFYKRSWNVRSFKKEALVQLIFLNVCTRASSNFPPTFDSIAWPLVINFKIQRLSQISSSLKFTPVCPVAFFVLSIWRSKEFPIYLEGGTKRNERKEKGEETKILENRSLSRFHFPVFGKNETSMSDPNGRCKSNTRQNTQCVYILI